MGERIMGKRVVITGASSGIGAATAEAFAAEGASLVIAARNPAALETVAQRCRDAGADVVVVPTDVTDADAVQALATRARDAMGGIDLWFSNVGVGTVGRFTDVPIVDHARVIETNLIGHINDAHAVLPIFLAQGRGVFVNMISTGGFVPMPQGAAYTASKFGLRGLSQALRGELSGHPDIHICDVYPTFVDTPALHRAGNRTGGRISVPPGVLDPRTVARAVVRLADHPRATTGVGSPAFAMRLAQIAPDLVSAGMDRFLSRYFAQAEPAAETSGNLHDASADDGTVDGGFRRPDQRRTAGLAAGAVGLAALVAGGAWWAARRRDA